MHAYNPSSWEVEAGGAGDQGCPWLLNKFKDSLGHNNNKKFPHWVSRYKGKVRWA